MNMSTLSTDNDTAAIMAALAHHGDRIVGITTDSRSIKPGMLFAAYPGTQSDGRAYISAAIAARAAGVIWEATNFHWPAEWKHFPNVAVHGLKQYISGLAAQIYGDPSRAMWSIAITGTNGKTSCAHWLARCFNGLGRKTAVIGTLGNGIYPDLVPSKNTTPDAAVVQAALAELKQAGAHTLAMEVSSEGLDQGRVNAVHFDVAVLTNLSRDHLNYHGSMAQYAATKARLFTWPELRYAIINQDDQLGKKLLQTQNTGVEQISYGFGAASICGSQLQLSAQGLSMRVDTPWGTTTLHAPVLGRFNASNLLACLGVLLVSGVPLDEAVDQLSQMQSPAGRMQIFGGDAAPWVVIDYAHTPDALEQVLHTLRELIPPQGKLICIVGCGGDRDTGKRVDIGELASRLADQVILTSDNPRSEDPEEIIRAMQSLMSGEEWIEVDRAKAIRLGIAHAQAGDIVLVAGKGHEDYQELEGVRYPFRDDNHVQQALKEKL